MSAADRRGLEVRVRCPSVGDRAPLLARVTDRILVRTSWIDVADVGGDAIVIVPDPGMAFGTAEHGATRGCLRLLEGVVEPATGARRRCRIGYFGRLSSTLGGGVVEVLIDTLGHQVDDLEESEGRMRACA